MLALTEKITMAAREAAECVRCGRTIETNESAVVMIHFLQTVGVKPRQKSGARRIYWCPQCAVVNAMGAKPGNGALNVAAYEQLRVLIGKDPSVTQSAWEELNKGVLARPEKGQEALPEPEILPPPKRLKEAS